MARFHTSIASAVALLVCGVSLPVYGASTPASRCTGTLAQYQDAIKQYDALAAKARALADENPLLESDVQYYTAVLADAKECTQHVIPVATASR
jgi:hypothetical protein